MLKINTFFYSLYQGTKNLRRNRMFSLASIGTMTACLFLFGIFYFILTNIQHILTVAEGTVGITVFFDDGLSNDDIEMIGNEILMDTRVLSIEYVSAEKTWEQYKEENLSEELAESFGDDNPLENSASYTVYTQKVEYQIPVADYIRGIEGIRQVNNSEVVAETLQSVNRVIAYLSAVIITILLGVATFLIGTTISMGISVRKQEISIMKLIGAADYFIRGPFIVEGVLLGIIGAAIPLVLLYGIYMRLTEYAAERFSSVFSTIQFVDINTVFSALVPISILIGLGIGFLGSYITLCRELRKIN